VTPPLLVPATALLAEPRHAEPRAMPLDGEPADVVARIERYDRWLAASPGVPKLLLTFDPGPGRMITAPLIDWCAANIAGLEVDRSGASLAITRPKTSRPRSPRPSRPG